MARKRRPGNAAGLATGAPGKRRRGSARQEVPTPTVLRGRPPRLAHLVPGSDRGERRDRAALSARLDGASLADRSPAGSAEPARASRAVGERLADALCLPNPEWLAHTLTVIGPTEDLAAFRTAAAGSGRVPWLFNYARLQEDWTNRMLAGPPAERGISVQGARIVGEQLRALIETQDLQAADHAHDDRSKLDLNALVPVPKQLLVLGPDDPAVLAWLWENWGTTWMLRGVEEVPVGAGLLIPQDHAGVSYRFWSADWTPWRALSLVRTRWPALTLHITMRSVAE